jgi:hypothetical protein
MMLQVYFRKINQISIEKMKNFLYFIFEKCNDKISLMRDIMGILIVSATIG